MKIKTVCELTGLTDRTVRYYIDEKLLTPKYTENYLGRKKFDFSEEDVATLKNIAVLRKFDFSVNEIKSMFETPQIIAETVSELVKRKTEAIASEESLLKTLQGVDVCAIKSVDELAQELSKPLEKFDVPKADKKFRVLRFILRLFKGLIIGVITWSPIVLALLMLFIRYKNFQYPDIHWIAVLQLLLILSPSFAVLIISRIKGGLWKKIVKVVLLFLCVVSIVIPYIYFMPMTIIPGSETTNIKYYRQLDYTCVANRFNVYNTLFPEWANYMDTVILADGTRRSVYTDYHYYYRNYETIDYTYDIYAEWPLKEHEFYKEVERAKELFGIESVDSLPRYINPDNVHIVEKGDYICYILSGENDPIFEPVDDNYTYDIFAYNEKEMRVRYITCHSLENGADQPYYLELEW